MFQFSNQELDSSLIIIWLIIAKEYIYLRMSSWTILKFTYHLFVTQSQAKLAWNFKYVLMNNKIRWNWMQKKMISEQSNQGLKTFSK